MAKKKKPKLKDQVWEIFSKYIRFKYANENGFAECVTCKRTLHWKVLQAGHFIDGRHNAILFDERNVHPQCVYCNIYNKAGHKVQYTLFIIDKYGRETVEELERLNKTERKFYKFELQEMLESYKKKVADLCSMKSLL